MGQLVNKSRRRMGSSRTDNSPLARVALSLLLGVLTVMVVAATADATPGSGQSEDLEWSDFDSQPLRVNIWHDRDEGDVYRKGEAVRVHFETNQDAYAVVYRIDAEGEVKILWPRSRLGDGFVFGGHTYNLPTPGAARIRAAGEDGVEYVEAIVSMYPFDLRQLDVDFHHESEDVAREFFIAGDPFLAMNEVNHEITGLEDPADFVATNYTSYFVGREVAHPRYMCSQCHDEDQSYRPYRDSCSIEIHYDYGWGNSWFGQYGYYPLYYYPTYYYVDPWTARPWVNYWYSPWYSWPRYSGYTWDWYYYDWNYSPYWNGNVWTRYKAGNRHYRPLSKDTRYKSVASGAVYSSTPGMFKSKAGKPTSEMDKAMRSKTVADRLGGKIPSDVVRSSSTSKGVYKNLDRQKHAATSFTKPEQSTTKAGLRIPSGDRIRSVTGRSTTGGIRSGDNGAATQVKPNPGKSLDTSGKTKGSRAWSKSGDSSRSGTRVQPVVPNKKGSRIWQGSKSGSGARNQDTVERSDSRDGSSKSSGSIRDSGSKSRAPVQSTPKVKPTSRSGQSPQKQSTPTRSSGSSGSSKKSGGSGSRTRH